MIEVEDSFDRCFFDSDVSASCRRVGTDLFVDHEETGIKTTFSMSRQRLGPFSLQQVKYLVERSIEASIFSDSRC